MFSTSLSLKGKFGPRYLDKAQQPQEQCYPFYQCVQYFPVSRQWYSCQCVQYFPVSKQWYSCQCVQYFPVFKQRCGCQCVQYFSVFKHRCGCQCWDCSRAHRFDACIGTQQLYGHRQRGPICMELHSGRETTPMPHRGFELEPAPVLRLVFLSDALSYPALSL